jgi:hypothetical protein
MYVCMEIHGVSPWHGPCSALCRWNHPRQTARGRPIADYVWRRKIYIYLHQATTEHPWFCPERVGGLNWEPKSQNKQKANRHTLLRREIRVIELSWHPLLISNQDGDTTNSCWWADATNKVTAAEVRWVKGQKNGTFYRLWQLGSQKWMPNDEPFNLFTRVYDGCSFSFVTGIPCEVHRWLCMMTGLGHGAGPMLEPWTSSHAWMQGKHVWDDCGCAFPGDNTLSQ